MSNICHDMENWAVQSPEEPGFHAVVTPDKSSCKEAYALKNMTAFTFRGRRM